MQLDVENDVLDITFDRLICFEVIEHFKQESSVKRLYNLLKPKGIAVITVPHKWWIFETHGAKLPLLPWNRIPFFSWLPKFIHEKYANARIYTRKRICRLLKSSGFEIIEVKLMTAPLDVIKNKKLKSFLHDYIFKDVITRNPFLATNIFVVAVKK